MPTGPKRPADSFPSPMGRGGLFFERVGTKLYHYRESASLEICTGALAGFSAPVPYWSLCDCGGQPVTVLHALPACLRRSMFIFLVLPLWPKM